MDGYPRLKTTIWYVALMIVCWGGAYLISVLREATPVRSVFVVGLAALGFGFFLGAVFSLGNWAWYMANQRMWEVRRLEAVTPTLELARVVATLTPEQAILLPQARYAAEIGVVPGLNGPEHFLITPFMNIPLTWVDQYVNELCTRVELYPVRRFASDSLEQRYAQAFTAWVTQPHMHLAVPANGPDPAKWVSPAARQRCVELIWGAAEEGEA